MSSSSPPILTLMGPSPAGGGLIATYSTSSPTDSSALTRPAPETSTGTSPTPKSVEARNAPAFSSESKSGTAVVHQYGVRPGAWDHLLEEEHVGRLRHLVRGHGSGGAGGHRHEDDQVILRLVSDAVGVPGAGDNGVACAEIPLLLSHGEATRTSQDVVDLVRALVGVDLLELAGEEAVCVVEEVRRVEEGVLHHLLLGER